ncbi:MAG: glycosyltransferase [Actinomycetota bacterium]
MSFTPHVPGPHASGAVTSHRRPLVVVAVGTDHHPFDRLVTWMDRWAAANPEVKVVIQRGTADLTDHAESRDLIPHPEQCRLFGSALAVVAHGGPSTIMDARAAGRVPIVLPRNPGLGEHVDDHQLRFGRHLDAHRLARLVTDVADLDAVLIEALVDPEAFLVQAEEGAVPGIVAFGHVLDDLLGVTTPVHPRPGEHRR